MRLATFNVTLAMPSKLGRGDRVQEGSQGGGALLPERFLVRHRLAPTRRG